jgi:pseudouridine-5'-phosphate glycosidase
MLETLAVPVIGVGTHEFPAFYTATSGLRLEHRIDAPADAARICRAHWSLGQAGILFANPIPQPYSLDPAVIERAVDEALADAARQGIRGKAMTPHLLAYVSQATHKQSLGANRMLALNNAAFAAELATALSALPPNA